MVRIAAFAYRDWARELFFGLWTQQKSRDLSIRIFNEPEQVDSDGIEMLNPDLVLFYGWSWKVPKAIVDNHLCLCLHPSPLPKYRGRTPIQNQIMAGETESAISIFKMTDEIDAGQLCYQREISLRGNMSDILLEIKNAGLLGTTYIIDKFKNNSLAFWDQKGEPTYCEKRTPDMSEITIEELQTSTPQYLYNKIRGLQYPYPNAFITCSNGERLYLTGAHCG